MRLKIHYLFIALFLSVLTSSFGQERKVAKGNKQFNQYAFVDSQKIYLRVAEEGYESADLFAKLGDSFYYNADYSEAVNWYSKLVEKYQSEVTPNQYFRYAQALRAEQEYDKSEEMIARYQELSEGSEDLYAEQSISEIKAKTIISAAGCWTKELLEDIPVVPQKHTVFRVKCPKHYPEMPLTGDLTTGVYWRPEGKEYLAGSPNSVFDAEDLEPAWNDFEELVWPALAQRIPAFEELKLTGGWAGYYDCNKLDNNAVVGKHPKYENVYMASGFTGRGLMQAPGIGRALMELITTGSYQTIDISCFSVERVLKSDARPEPYVL